MVGNCFITARELIGVTHMKIDVLKILERDDKWYLGGGNRLLWAPPFPVFLDSPGAWDFLSYFDMRIDPGYAISTMKNGIPIDFKCVDRTWNPAVLKSRFSAENIELIEEKALLEEDFLLSKVTLKNMGEEPIELDVVVWTAQQCSESDLETDITHAEPAKNGILFGKKLIKPNRRPIESEVMLALEAMENYNITFSERTANIPNFRLTPFYEKLSKKGLLAGIVNNGINRNGLLYMGVHRRITIDPMDESVFVCGLGAAQSGEEVIERGERLLSIDPVKKSTETWERYFASLPQFRVSDPFMQTYYYYRWYGLKLFTSEVSESFMKHPAIAEGLDYFRALITYSAQCHILETRWSNSPSIGQGSLLNFLENQKEDGAFVGHIYVNQIQENGFYHADWGRAIRDLHSVHPDIDFISRIYEPLKKYLAYFDSSRDQENSGLYDVVDQFETGQEFMSRYTAVDPMSDRYGWTNNIRLKGVDATVYVYNLKKALSWMAGILGLDEESSRFKLSAEKTKKAVLETMWDPDYEIFSDVNPANFKRTGVKAAVCFYPYLTDIVDESHIPGLKKHLLNPAEFWTEFPVPATSLDDHSFSQWAEWKGKRHNCPWNGRVWPMTNSHIVDVLGICARRFKDPLLREKTVEIIEKFIKMMFFDGDPRRPNCFEHYNPFNGRPSIYRGVDDYQHSWIIDLLIRYVVGIDISENGIEFDPFPFDLDFEIDNLEVAGRQVRVVSNNGAVEVQLGGKTTVIN